LAVSKTQILQNAQSYMAKGNLDKAIDEWQKLISESPNDGNIYNTIGDLFLRKTDHNKATDSYLKAAEVFNNAGFALKSIALYKKILKLNPKRHDVYLKLSDVNAERGLTGNAIEGYLSVAKQYNQDGRVKDAIGVYRKIANLDPNNNSIRLNLAELCFKEGFEEEAVKEYLYLAKVYTEAGQAQDAETTYEKILKLDPTNEEARAAIGIATPAKEENKQENILVKAEAAMEEGVYDQAEQLLRQLISTDPGNPTYQEKLGQLFLKKGQHFMAFNPLKTAAQIYLENGDADRTVVLMKEFLTYGSDQAEAHQLLASASEQKGDIEEAISELALVIDQHLLMNEQDQAKSLFEKIKSMNAEHPDVQRLQNTFEHSLTEEAGKMDSDRLEVNQPQEPAVEVLETNPPEASQLQEPIEALETTQPEVNQVQEPAKVDVSGQGKTAETAILPKDEMTTMNLLTEAEVYTKYGLIGKAIDQLHHVLDMESDNVQARLQLKDIYHAEGRTSEAAEECLHLASIYKKLEDDDAYNKILQEAHQLDPEHPRLKEETSLADLLDSGRMEAVLGDQEMDRTEELQEQVEDKQQLESDNAIVAEAGETSTVKINESLEDTQDIEEDFESPFSSLISDIESETPAPTDAVEEHALIESAQEQKVLEKETAKEPAIKSEDFLDLSQIMDEIDEVTSPPPPAQTRDNALRSVISVFQDKETEAQQEDVDPETHYNLGIAYSEMGLITEAIEEFKLSAKSSERFIDSQSMLSACYRKKNKLQEATQTLEIALADSRCKDSEVQWLSYDLAFLYEQLDRFDDAIKLYTKIYSEHPSFKDVKQRLDTLHENVKKGSKTVKTQQQAHEQDEEIDSMFERLYDDSLSGDDRPDSEQKDPNKKKSRIS
jgi:tetratricopeptide (TPR) repeat protein